MPYAVEFHEASWSRSNCHDIVDRCHRAGWFDEIHYAVLMRTAIPYAFEAWVPALYPFMDIPAQVRCANRSRDWPGTRSESVGFRVARRHL